jgi:hypothetical protein
MIFERRLSIFFAAESVKVRQRIEEGSVSVLSRMLAIRTLKSSVFPDPGPAITKRGPSIQSTAWR